QDLLVVIVEPGGADIDDAGLAVRVLLEADDFAARPKRRVGIDVLGEATFRIAEIGHGIERDLRHRFAEHGVEHEEIVERALLEAEPAGEAVGGLQHETRAVDRVVERGIALGQRARCRMHELLVKLEVLEIVAGAGLDAHAAAPWAAIASAMATVW